MTDQPERERGKGRLLGMPYNLTRPTSTRDALSSVWNGNDSRVLTPKRIGWGYDINFYWVRHPLALVRARTGGHWGTGSTGT